MSDSQPARTRGLRLRPSLGYRRYVEALTPIRPTREPPPVDPWTKDDEDALRAWERRQSALIGDPYEPGRRPT